MSAPNQSTFDGNPNVSPPVTSGYRPGLADFNGAALQDDTANPPDPQSMPTSPVWNTFAYELVSVGRMIPVGSFGIVAQVGPTVSFWNVAANNVVADPFAPVRNGAGDYTISWPSGLLPLGGAPVAIINQILGAVSSSIVAQYLSATSVRVQTTQGGVLTDLNFSVQLF